MQQHPVPRNITGFQFKLIGDMTLKQFGYLAAGVITGYVLFRFFPGPGIIKLVLGLAFGGGGAALAFLPIQGRPFDVWVVSFIKSVYSPTQFVWKKQAKVPSVLLKRDERKKASEKAIQEEEENMRDVDKKLNRYMKNKSEETREKVEREESQKIKQKSTRIKQIGTDKTHLQASKHLERKNTKTRKHENTRLQEQDSKIVKQQTTEGALSVQGNKPQGGWSPLAEFMRGEDTKSIRTQKQEGQEDQKRKTLRETEELRKTEKVEKGAQKGKSAAQEKIQEEYKKEIERLEKRKAELEKRLGKMSNTEDTEQLRTLKEKSVAAETQGQNTKTRKHENTKTQDDGSEKSQKTMGGEDIKKKLRGGLTEVEILERSSASEFGFPQMPDKPNLISGVVLDPVKKPLPGILVTVRAGDKTIVRALKTNSLGQFSSTTPLKDGVFYLEIEDPEGKFVFDIIKLRLHGSAFKPVEVIARKRNVKHHEKSVPKGKDEIKEKLFAKT